jgi:hypothetical protein
MLLDEDALTGSLISMPYCFRATNDPADVRISFVIGLKGHVGLGLRTARPTNLKAGTLRNGTLDLKMPCTRRAARFQWHSTLRNRMTN